MLLIHTHSLLILCQTFLTIIMLTAGMTKTPTTERVGCTAPFLFPDKPFLVVWNHPTQACENHGVHIDFSKWGIVDNDKDQFVGDKISLLYRPGDWPYYLGSKVYNGGIPQAGNLSLHIASLKEQINSEIPHQDFSGLGVIDFEHWRPLYYLNFDKLRIYQEKSLELARKEHPHFNKSQVLNEAVRDFQNAARTFIDGSLKTLHKLRPDGQFGYYGYPRCWDKNCNGSTVSINDRMGWVFAASQGLYPSIYFDLSLSPADRTSMITKRLLETLRVHAKWAPTDSAILPYALSQDGPEKMFSNDDLHYSVRLPADLGSSGVVLWGSSDTMHGKNECLVLQDYVNTTLGPFAKQAMDFFSDCSAHLCSSHGRCVLKDYELVYQCHLVGSHQHGWNCWRSEKALRRDSAATTDGESYNSARTGKLIVTCDFDDYVCRCLSGWSGPHCDVQ